MRSLIVIFGVLIVGIIFIVVWDFSSNSTIDQTNYNEISWRLPLDKEVKKVGDSFFHSDVELCATYFIKKFEGEKYLIACDSGDGSWTYYTAYASQNKVYLTPNDLTSSLIPPMMMREQPDSDPLKQNSKISENKGSPPKTIITK